MIAGTNEKHGDSDMIIISDKVIDLFNCNLQFHSLFSGRSVIRRTIHRTIKVLDKDETVEGEEQASKKKYI